LAPYAAATCGAEPVGAPGFAATTGAGSGLGSTRSMVTTAGPAGATVSTSGTTPGTNQNAASQASAGTASAVGSSVLQSSGPSIPSLDPTLTSTLSWAHVTTPQSSAFTTGTNALINKQDISNFGIQKGFLTGTTVTLGLNNNSVTSNSVRTSSPNLPKRSRSSFSSCLTWAGDCAKASRR
jgi:hypothetical protein